MLYSICSLYSVEVVLLFASKESLCKERGYFGLVVHNYPSIPLDSESTQMFSHLLAASRQCSSVGENVLSNGRDRTEAQPGREGWGSPVPEKKQEDLQRGDPADLESDLTLCCREHKSPPIHNSESDNSFHLLH